MEIQILLLPWTSALTFFKSSCVGLETWQGNVYELLAMLGVSKLENAVAQVQEQFKDKEWKDRDGKENSFTVDKAADLVSVQAKEASKGQARVGLGPKEKEEIGKLRGRHVMLTTHEKLRNLLCIYSFQSHIQFSQFCYFVTVASIA